MDANETGKFYKSTIKFKVPVSIIKLNMNTEKAKQEKFI